MAVGFVEFREQYICNLPKHKRPHGANRGSVFPNCPSFLFATQTAGANSVSMHKDSANGHFTPNPKNDLQGAIIPAARVNAPQEQPVPPLPESPSDYQQSHFPFEGEEVKRVPAVTNPRPRTVEEGEAHIHELFLLGEIPPLNTWLFWQGEPAIIADTQNSIQGRAKAHKSRLAETMVACALGDPTRDYCGFTRAEGVDFHILFFDTERSIRKLVERKIQIFRATNGRHSPQLFPLDIVPLRPESNPEKRLKRLEDRVQATREKLQSETALFVVADVMTDFMINGLLDPVEAAKYAETLNGLLGMGNTAFLTLIHDSEAGERKAGGSGHGGRILAQKCTNGWGIEKDKPTGWLTMSAMFCRESAEPPPMPAAFDPETGLLKTITPERREQRMETVRKEREATTAERMQIVFSALFSDGEQERRLREVVAEMKKVFRGGKTEDHSLTLKETTGPKYLYRDRFDREFWVRSEQRKGRGGRGKPVFFVREQATATAISPPETA